MDGQKQATRCLTPDTTTEGGVAVLYSAHTEHAHNQPVVLADLPTKRNSTAPGRPRNRARRTARRKKLWHSTGLEQGKAARSTASKGKRGRRKHHSRTYLLSVCYAQLAEHLYCAYKTFLAAVRGMHRGRHDVCRRMDCVRAFLSRWVYPCAVCDVR